MDLSEPAQALVPGLGMPLLRALASRGTPATADQLRRSAQAGTPAGVRRALDRLVEHGLVLATQAGERTTLYELNREHILFSSVSALLDTDEALALRLRDTMAGWAPAPRCAALFGSAARHTGDTSSDIDLLLVQPEPPQQSGWDDQVHQLRERVHQWTGNHLQVLERSVDELRQMLHCGETIIEEWQRDAVTVFGHDLNALLRELR